MRTIRPALLILAMVIAGLAEPAWANQAPTVSITSPVNEYEDLIAPANMTIMASASDSDGTISKVEFYQNGALLGQSTQSPFSFTWTGIAQSRYALTAKATDNGGAVTTSATVYVTINGATVNGFLDRRWYSSSSSTSYIPYRLFMPANYNASIKYPVVIFLHGIGEQGTNNTNQLGNNCNGAGVFVSAANQTAFPCFMICPQSSSGWWGTEPNSITKKIQAKFNADIDRLYITGLSAGGISTWQMLIAENTLYAAAVPICGNGDTSRANLLTGIPIWDFHCADDPTVGVSGSDQMISAIRAAGGNPIYTRYAQGGHGSWVPAYGNAKLVPWVMAQRRGVASTNAPLTTITTPTNAQTYTASAATIDLTGTTIDASAAVTQVTWSNSMGGSGTASGTSNWSISGIPLVAGANLIQVIASGTSYNANYGGVTTFNDTIKVTVGGTPQETPYNGTAFAIPGTIPAAQFDNGGEGVAYHDADVTNSGGQFRTTGVDIEGCSEGGYDIGWTAAGEWLNYMVNVGSAGSYDIQARVAAPAAGATFHINFGSTNIGTFNVPNTGGYQTWQTVTVSNVALSAGPKIMQIYEDSGGFNVAYIQVVPHAVANTAPTISAIVDRKIIVNANTGALAFTVGDTQTPAASLTVSGSSNNTTLVPNANIVFGGSGANRTVTVTPAAGQKGSATITLTVSDGSLTASTSFVLTVSDVAAAIDCGGTVNYTAADGTVYSADAFNNGGSVNNFVRPISNTVDDALYQNYRWLSPVLDYSIPVANGTYAVTLKFADIYSTAAGQKIFDVSVNGGLVARALDTYALVGPDTAYDITCAATVSNGILNLQFLNPAAGNPSVSAILVKARVNRAPTAGALQISTTAGTAKAVTLSGADLDGDYLLYTILTQPVHGALSGKAPNLTYTPAAGYVGADSFTYKVSDGASSSATATVSITVTSPNRSPVFSSAATASPNPATVGQSVVFSAAAGDPDGDALSYSWSFGDGSSASGASTTHAYAAAGTYNATVTVNDGRGGTASSGVTVVVTKTVAINSGGAAVGSFAADQGFSGGNTYTSTSTINISGVTNPAPQAVYQSERYGNFTYTVSSLTPGASYTVRLHFAEIWWNGAGQRVFNVAINGTQVLANFDIFAATGGKFIATVKTFTATATASGQIAIVYSTIVDNAKSSGIEIIDNGPAARGVKVATVAEPALLDDGGAISSIDLGTVKVGVPFKIKLDAPQSGKKARLHWGIQDRTKIASGVAARGGMVGGRPKTAGTYTFHLQIKGRTTSATNTYTLTVIE